MGHPHSDVSKSAMGHPHSDDGTMVGMTRSISDLRRAISSSQECISNLCINPGRDPKQVFGLFFAYFVGFLGPAVV